MSKTEHPEIYQAAVSDAFNLLAKNTELPLHEYTAITDGQSHIEQYLAQHISTFSTVLYGGFSRKTIVSPLPGSIIDMLVLFRERNVNNIYPTRIFSELAEALIEKFTDAYIIKDKNILILPVDGFEFKIHPAYPLSEHIYMLPSQKFNDWVKYDLKSYNDLFTKQNVRHKGKLIEIIRIIKTWNRVSGNLFNGFYLEILVTEVLTDYKITSYSETICFVFNAALSEVVFQKHDPANVDFLVEGLNDINHLIAAMRLLKKSYRLANSAINYEQDDDVENALKNWNKIFPQVFPTRLDMIVGRARSTGIKGADALKLMVNHKQEIQKK